MPVYVEEFVWELTWTIVCTCTNVTSINNKYCSRFFFKSIHTKMTINKLEWILPPLCLIHLTWEVGYLPQILIFHRKMKNCTGEIIFLQDILKFSKDFQKFLQDWCLSKDEFKVFLYKNLVLKGNAPLGYKISYCILKSDWRIFLTPYPTHTN